MRTLVISFAVLAVTATTAAADHWTPACRKAVEAPDPDRATVDACLPDRAGIIVAGLIGYQHDLRDGGGISGFLRIDKPIGKRLWVEAKARYHTTNSFQGDLLVGLVFGHRHGTGYAEFNSNISDSPGVRTITVTKHRTVLRKDYVLAAGAKLAVSAKDDMGERNQGVYGALGLQKHGATGFGSHSVIEGFAIYGSDGFGGTLAWHNSIPPTKGIVFGMEAGYVPDTMLYWAIVELGYSFEP
jgi:hypothetical protein